MNPLMTVTTLVCTVCLFSCQLQAAAIVTQDHQPGFLEYDNATGELYVVATGQRGFNAIEIRSESEAFLIDVIVAPAGSLVTDTEETIGFLAFPFFENFVNSGETYNLGPVLPAGMGLADVAADLSGFLLKFGSPNVEIAIAPRVPEPATAILCSIAVMGLVGRRRRA